MNTRKIVSAAGIAGALIFTSACSAPQATSAAGTPAAADSASAAATPSATPTPTSKFPYTLPTGLIAKGVANDGHGDYIQTSIADTDPAMKYNPAITDDAAKAHFSETDLSEAQKVIVRFIAEEAIDSTLNDGADVHGWWAAHKDQIHPGNMVMLTDLESSKDILARERWMATEPGYTYAHGDKPRVTKRTITPLKLGFVENGTTQGVWLDTKANYSMAVTSGPDQISAAEITFTAAKDPADGKWKIAGYDTNYHTGQAGK